MYIYKMIYTGIQKLENYFTKGGIITISAEVPILM